ncbi:hypothetical protein AJ80_04470 [Polytolypa hystricis UAMH7299]|uniref:Protein CFT1 n=1 Tax=Polytolypa hystricis (strain UAMH7299) TaxID=1447883 RepID=A0A2B7YBD4_POLH7|nr:hypothetical protein AJ80_04470 [Polytolypa hystricis UAMH7299]
MQCYTELLPPSGVTHALALPFLSASSNNLIVAKSSLLQLFNLVTVTVGSGQSNSDERGRSQYTKLVLIAEYALPGVVAGLGRVTILSSKSGGQALLVAIRDAKLSLVQWDPDEHKISTTSIHFYEREDILPNPWAPDLASCPSHLTVDPSSRCALLHYGLRNLAILPFHQRGDDLVMDDYDHDIDGERPEEPDHSTEGETKSRLPVHNVPYSSSFVLPLTALDPLMVHPISLAFLYEYREPTFGILYSQVAKSSSLLHERKDIVFYSVVTLDLEQRASTTLVSVPRLPSDLFMVVPLPPPVGGALLIGGNELVHIDQAGKSNAVGVNEFARQASTFSMADQSDLEVRLEGCHVQQMGSDSGDMLLVLASGKMMVLSFKLDGRSVSGIYLRFVSDNAGGSIMKAKPSCSVTVDRGRIFFGSEDSDSVIIGWSHALLHGKKSRPPVGLSDESLELLEGDEDEDEDEDDDMYEDDLYSTPAAAPSAPQGSTTTNGVKASDYVFRVHDRLWNLGPTKDITVGRLPGPRDKEKRQSLSGLPGGLELVSTQGYGRAGGLTVLRREIEPYVIDSLKIKETVGAWSVYVKSAASGLDDNSKSQSNHDQYLIFSKSIAPEKEASVVYTMGSSGLEETKTPEFNPNEDCTVDIGTLAGLSRVVQVLKGEVRSYDSGLGLAQIYPIWDEDTSEERIAVRASFADPFLLIARDDQSILLLQADDSGDLDELPIDGVIKSSQWVSGTLYRDKSRFFIPEKNHSSEDQMDNILLFLLGTDGKLLIFHLTNLSAPLCILEGVDLLPQLLTTESTPRRSLAREIFTEILVADLGDPTSQLPYLILRNENNDVIMYEAYHTSTSEEGSQSSVRFSKVVTHCLGKPSTELTHEEQRGDTSHPLMRRLRPLEDVCGYRTVFIPGTSPSFIIKSSVSIPHVIPMRSKAVYSLSSFHVPACEKGIVYVDIDNVVRMARFPGNTRYDHSWSLRKVGLGEQVDCVVYSSTVETYILGTSHKLDFKLPEDDEVHTEWRSEDISFLPQIDTGSVKLVSPKTWTIIDSYPLNPSEVVMSMKVASLEVSEHTHEFRNMIVVGTATARGEDIAARGCIYIFEVIEVVPEVDRPETNRKLKLFAKEEVRGAVTAVSGIGGQGFLIAAQGQKCIVRGLKEDGSLLPVAFMDMQCYTSVIKELKGTGLCIMGDALKGIWFTGYSEEPYKLTLFGKDNMALQVVAADFLPDGKRLYILVADDTCTLHVLQYDPEDPASAKGDQLLRRSTFHTGHYTSTLTLLPRTPTLTGSMEEIGGADGSQAEYQVLTTSDSGSIATITPVPEESYRRLSSLQSHLMTTIEHACGLNPRAYRAVESDGVGGRGMLDGDLLKRWLQLSTPKRAEIANRVGADMWEIRKDLEAVGGNGLGYL